MSNPTKGLSYITPAIQFSDTPGSKSRISVKNYIYAQHSIQAIPRVNSLSLRAHKWHSVIFQTEDTDKYFHAEIQTRQEPLIDSARISAEHVLISAGFISGQIWSCVEFFKVKTERAKRQVCMRQETLQQILKSTVY